ncbi:MAG: DUF3857 domain-containing protein [Vicinamibacterales bacterium]
MRTLLIVAATVEIPAMASAQTVPTVPPESGQAFIIESLQARYRFERDGTGVRSQRAKVKVLSDAGVQAWGQLAVGYASAFETLVLTTVEVHKPDGQVLRPSAEAVQDTAVVELAAAPTFTDLRQKLVTMPGLRPGDTVVTEFTWTVHTPPSKDHYWLEHRFNRVGATPDETLEVDVPDSRVFHVTTVRSVDAPTIREANGRRVYQWHWSHTGTAEPTEPGTPSLGLAPVPDVLGTTFGSWAEVADWYERLVNERAAPDATVREKAAALTKNLTSDADRVRALFEFVAQEVRYVSLSFGAGRFTPHAAKDVLAAMYGDCKDKHVLLAALLSASGLRAHAVLAASATEISTDAPSRGQFDHLFTVVAAGRELAQWTWLDATIDAAPAGYLAPSIRDHPVLIVGPPPAVSNPTGWPLVTAPRTLPFPSELRTRIDATVNGIGVIKGKVRHTLRGDSEVAVRTLLRPVPPAQYGEAVKTFNQSLGLGGEASGLELVNLEAPREALAIGFTWKRSGFLDWAQSRSRLTNFLPPLQLRATQASAWSSGSRVEVGPAVTVSYDLRLELPPGYDPRPPTDVSLTRDYGSYRASYAVTGQVLTASRTFTLGVDSLPADRSADYLAFVAAIQADVQQAISVVSTTTAVPAIPSDATTAELYDAARSAYRSTRYEASAALNQRIVEIEPKHANAWDALGLALWQQGKNEDAEMAFLRQIQINQFHSQAYRDLARVLRARGNKEGAVAALEKHLQISPLDGDGLTSLGSLYRSLDRHADAARVLEKAAGLEKPSSTVFEELGLAYLSLGKTDEGMSALERRIATDTSASTLAGVSYELAERRVALDRALAWATRAVELATAPARTLKLESFDPLEPGGLMLEDLASAWEAMGLTLLRRGDPKRALDYLDAAWCLDTTAETAEIIGASHEALGDRAAAADWYARAIAAFRDAKPRLVEALNRTGGIGVDPSALAGGFDALITSRRSIQLSGAMGRGKAVAFVAVNAEGVIEDTRFFGGDAEARPAVSALKGRRLPARIPTSLSMPLVVVLGLVSGEQGHWLAVQIAPRKVKDYVK